MKSRIWRCIYAFLCCLVLLAVTAALAPTATLPEIAIADTSVTEPIAYFPIVKDEYDWTAIDQWTLWGLQDIKIREFYVGPEPEWVWGLSYEQGLYRSTDYGNTWLPVSTPFAYSLYHMAIRSNNQNDYQLYASTRMGEVISSTNGITWTLDSNLSTSISHLEWVDEDLLITTLYLSEDRPAQILRRNTSGDWSTYASPLPASVLDFAVFQESLYAGTMDGLYRLIGDQWEPVTIYPGSLDDYHHTLLVHNGILFVGTGSSRGLHRSTDGEIWEACDVGLTGAYGPSVRRLLASEDGTLYAQTHVDGVFMSENNGDRWMALHGGLDLSTTAYGQLLDDVPVYALIIMRDGHGQQTLGAHINYAGYWIHTVTDETWLGDVEVKSPPKAVLVVGPADPPDHNTTKLYISQANQLADILTRNGMQVVKVYWPNSTWEQVRASIEGASIVVYKGHGFGVNDLPVDTTEMYGGLNGFCLVHPEDPAGARLGTQDMLVTTNRLAKNAISFFWCCYCSGVSGFDDSYVAESLARRRIEAYASTPLRMGGGGYFSAVDETRILEMLFANPDMTLGEIYRNVQGAPEHVYPHVVLPDTVVWFDGNTSSGWGQAFVGDPNLTANDVLGR